MYYIHHREEREEREYRLKFRTIAIWYTNTTESSSRLFRRVIADGR
jgi:hypothetical protein